MKTAVIRLGSRGVALVLSFLCGCSEKPMAIEHEIIARGSAESLKPSGAIYRVIDSQTELSDLYGSLHAGRLPRPEPPRIDFTRSLVLLVAMERQPTAGYAIDLPPPRLKEDILIVSVVFRTPPMDRPRAMVITRPYVLSRVSRTRHIQEVEFRNVGGDVLRRIALD